MPTKFSKKGTVRGRKAEKLARNAPPPPDSLTEPEGPARWYGKQQSKVLERSQTQPKRKTAGRTVTAPRGASAKELRQQAVERLAAIRADRDAEDLDRLRGSFAKILEALD